MMLLALDNQSLMVFLEDIPKFVGTAAFATATVTLSMTKSVDSAFLALSLPMGHSQSAMVALGNVQDESNGPGDVASLTFLDLHPFLLDPYFLFALRTDPNFG